MLRKPLVASCAALLLFTATTQSFAHPFPPPPPSAIAGGGGGGGMAAGFGVAAAVLALVCFVPYALSEERRKHDAAWRNHIDALPCGWDVVLAAQPGEATPVVRPAPPRKSRAVCIKDGTVAKGGCTRY